MMAKRDRFNEVGIEFRWWMVPGGLLLALFLALAAFWVDQQGLWPDWLGFDYGGGFFDQRTGERIPILKE